MNVVLLGPPGVGKGTQGALLMEATGWERIATGDLLREARRQGTDLGRAAQGYMDRGELVPDTLIIDLVRERLTSLPSDRGVVFDGFPRNVSQAEALEEVLSETGRSLDRVVVLEADDETLVKRIAGRRVHLPSGRVYNVYFEPPQAEGKDDITGEPLVHREDDRAETVRRRLEVYREQTEPLVRHYEEAGAEVVTIDAARQVDEVQHALREALGVDR